MTAAVPALELQNLSFRYGNRRIFHKTSLTVPKGELVALTGLSGSGKTTLLRLINGAILRDERYTYEGQILIHGMDLKELTHDSYRIGTVYEDGDSQLLFTEVRDEIVFGMENHCFDQVTMTSRLSTLAEAMGIHHLLDRHPTTLSGGEKKLVVLASVLCLDLDLLLLDEPTSGMDEGTQGTIMALIERMRDEGTTVIMATHSDRLMVMADRILRIEDDSINGIH